MPESESDCLVAIINRQNMVTAICVGCGIGICVNVAIIILAWLAHKYTDQMLTKITEAGMESAVHWIKRMCSRAALSPETLDNLRSISRSPADFAEMMKLPDEKLQRCTAIKADKVKKSSEHNKHDPKKVSEKPVSSHDRSHKSVKGNKATPMPATSAKPSTDTEKGSKADTMSKPKKGRSLKSSSHSESHEASRPTKRSQKTERTQKDHERTQIDHEKTQAEEEAEQPYEEMVI